MSAWDKLFEDQPDYLVEAALAALHDLDLGAGEVLMRPGDEDPAMLYVVSGRVSVSRRGVQIDESGPGEVVGEMSLFRGTPRVAEIRTLEPTRALLIDRAAYEALVQGNNPVAFRLERIILEQMGHRLRRLDALVGKNSDGVDNPYVKPPKSFFAQLKDAILNKGSEPPVEERKIDAAAVLDGSRLFRDERYTLIEGLVRYTEHFVWTKGQTLCDQGEEGDAFYLIASGRADVYVRSGKGRIHRLGSVGPGAAVGMTSLIDGRPRMATVIATEQVDALEFPKSTFDALVSQDGQLQSALRRAMIRAFADQVDEAGANLIGLAKVDVPGEVTAHVATEIYSE